MLLEKDSHCRCWHSPLMNLSQLLWGSVHTFWWWINKWICLWGWAGIKIHSFIESLWLGMEECLFFFFFSNKVKIWQEFSMEQFWDTPVQSEDLEGYHIHFTSGMATNFHQKIIICSVTNGYCKIFINLSAYKNCEFLIQSSIWLLPHSKLLARPLGMWLQSKLKVITCEWYISWM